MGLFEDLSLLWRQQLHRLLSNLLLKQPLLPILIIGNMTPRWATGSQRRVIHYFFLYPSP